MYLLGIRPSGTKGIHLGHYIGVFSVAKKLDNVNILIADLYEDCTSVELFMKQIQQLLPNANLILQSSFKNDLFNIKANLEKIVNVSELSRMTQYKSKTQKQTANLLTYPLLMCADLMMFGSQRQIIVGKDQHQHIEYANDFIKRYAKHYNKPYDVVKTLTVEPLTVMDLKNPEIKMSKSNEEKGTLYLLEKELISKKITGANTNELGLQNLNNIYAGLTNEPSQFTKALELKEAIIQKITNLI